MAINYIGKCILLKNKNKKILVIGDLHLGYEEVLNRSGVFVSRQMFDEMIFYLDKIFSKIGKVDSVILLGDVKHDFGSIVKQEWNDVLGLFDYLENKLKAEGKIIITRGNHDKIIEPIARKRENVKLLDYYILNEFCFLHGDKSFDKIYGGKIKYWIMGHGHPAVKISDGVKVEKYKCFLEGKYKNKEVIVVPSFFTYSEGSDPRENELGLAWKFNFNKFDVKIVGLGENLEVLDFGKLGRLEQRREKNKEFKLLLLCFGLYFW